MTRTQTWLLTAAALVVAALCVWGGMGLTRHAIEALDAVKDTARQTQPAIQNVTAVTEDVRKTSTQQAQALLAIERDVRVEMWDLNRTLLSTRGAITEAQGAIGDVRGSLTHANGTMDAATGALGSVKREADSLVTLTDAATVVVTKSGGAVDDFDALLKSPDLAEALQHTNKTLVHIENTTGSFEKVADHIEKKVDTPKTKKQQVMEWTPLGIRAGISLACLLTGSC